MTIITVMLCYSTTLVPCCSTRRYSRTINNEQESVQIQMPFIFDSSFRPDYQGDDRDTMGRGLVMMGRRWREAFLDSDRVSRFTSRPTDSSCCVGLRPETRSQQRPRRSSLNLTPIGRGLEGVSYKTRPPSVACFTHRPAPTLGSPQLGILLPLCPLPHSHCRLSLVGAVADLCDIR